MKPKNSESKFNVQPYQQSNGSVQPLIKELAVKLLVSSDQRVDSILQPYLRIVEPWRGEWVKVSCIVCNVLELRCKSKLCFLGIQGPGTERRA